MNKKSDNVNVMPCIIVNDWTVVYRQSVIELCDINHNYQEMIAFGFSVFDTSEVVIRLWSKKP